MEGKRAGLWSDVPGYGKSMRHKMRLELALDLGWAMAHGRRTIFFTVDRAESCRRMVESVDWQN